MSETQKDKRGRFVLLGMGIIVAFLVIGTMLFMQFTSPPIPIPSTGAGAFIFIDGEWVGGDIIDGEIHLQNGTVMDFDVWKKAVGFEGN